MAISILLGASAWDCVPYVRNLIEDTAGTVVPDGAIQVYMEDVAEDFSRHLPLDCIVGNAYANTSTMNTVVGQQRYVLNSTNGFTPAPMWTTDVLYRAGTGYSAASEIAYLALLPFSPINRFLFTPSLLDSPSERILRDQYLSELEHYGNGYYKEVRDNATGLPAIDLYPIPVVGNIPIYVRYQAMHAITGTSSPFSLTTVPENFKRAYAKLLAAMVFEEEGDRIVKARAVKAGLIDVQADSRTMEERIVRWRDEAYSMMGMHAAVGAVGNQ